MLIEKNMTTILIEIDYYMDFYDLTWEGIIKTGHNNPIFVCLINII